MEKVLKVTRRNSPLLQSLGRALSKILKRLLFEPPQNVSMIVHYISNDIKAKIDINSLFPNPALKIRSLGPQHHLFSGGLRNNFACNEGMGIWGLFSVT